MRHLFLALIAVMGLPAASAFGSAPPGSSPHDDITAIATHLGWPAGAVKSLQQAVREPDYDEMELDPKAAKVTRFDATELYRADHHCDRIPPAADLDAFNATVVYIQSQRDAAASVTGPSDAKAAMEALGRALHALQDCFSHSNAVDLSPAEQRAHHDAVLGQGPAVRALRLVSFQPGAADPETPPGDSYPHGDFNKDFAKGSDEAEARLPDGRSKYEATKQLAENATFAFLQAFEASLTVAGREALMAVEPEKDRGIDRIPIPAAAPALLLACLALAAVAARRR